MWQEIYENYIYPILCPNQYRRDREYMRRMGVETAILLDIETHPEKYPRGAAYEQTYKIAKITRESFPMTEKTREFQRYDDMMIEQRRKNGYKPFGLNY